MNLQSQDHLAKLLAKENLTVQHGNFQTASFNVVDRVLSLPLWADKGKAVHDLLVGHEVGHALYTPADGWHDSDKTIPGVPRSMINIIEDIRIEKLIQRTYPGIVKSFKSGYKTLFDDDLFGTVGKDLTKYGFMDKLNIQSKGRGYAEVSFDATEQLFVDLAMAVETWDDVLNACKEINTYLANKEDYEEEEEEEEGEENDDTETNDTTGDQSDETGSPMESGDDICEETEGTSGDTPIDESESLTDQAQRSNSSDLLEKDEEGKQPAFCNGLKDADINKLVIDYKQLSAARKERNINTKVYESEYINTKYNEFMNDSKKIVMAMAREFERKKAAFEYSRSQTAKKGSLDVNKLHQYQYSEDIFKTVTKLAQAKNHGIVMAVDWSGSMTRIIVDVVKQTIILAQFCKRVNIPFEIYTFTSGSNNTLSGDFKTAGSMLGADRVKLVEITNNMLSKSEYNTSIKHFFTAAVLSGDSNAWYESGVNYNDLCSYERMGSTPLIETTMLLTTIVKKFQARYAIQNTNIIVLTDGDANYIDVKRVYGDNYSDITSSKVVMDFHGKAVMGSSTDELYTNCVKEMKRQTGATVMCLFLAESKYDFKEGYYKIRKSGEGSYAASNLKYREFNSEGIISAKNACGYDTWSVVKVGQRSDDEFEIKDNKNGNDIAIKDIKKQFRSFSKSKKHTKKLVSTITDTLAA